MPIRGSFIAPARRLRLGADVLSAARVVETHPVNERLARFETAHRRYVATQDDVTTGEQRLRVARIGFRTARGDLDRAVDDLARALIADGAPRLNPFAGFGAPSPGQLSRLAVEKATKSVDRLVAVLRRARSITQQTSTAIAAAERATRAIEKAVRDIERVEDELRIARTLRDAHGHAWHSAFTALRHGARAAADEGAPRLYAMLFAPPRRSKRRPRTPRG